jgi:hypothetical protein
MRFWRSLLTPSFHLLWALVVLMAVVIPLATMRAEKPGEFYPFSNFPMYSRFAPDTYYVFVTDLEDRPVAVGPTFSIAISDVKKAYDRRLEALKKSTGSKARRKELPRDVKEGAAVEVLRWLVQNSKQPEMVKAHKGLRLHQTDIAHEGGRVRKTTEAVGEITLPGS